MNKNVCFIELIKDKNGFIKAEQSVETACLRAYLKGIGIETMIYIDESLPSIYDMAEDILSLSDEVLVFVVDTECRGITTALISYIRELEDTEIYVIGEILNIEEENIVTIESRPEVKLREVLGNLSRSDPEDMNPDIFSVSPYASGVLQARDAGKYGIWLGRSSRELRKIETIKDDISKLLDTYSGLSDLDEKVVSFHGFFIEDRNYLEDIIELIRKVELTFLKFIIPVQGNLLADINKLSGSTSQCIFLLNFELVPDGKDIGSLSRLIQKQKISGIHFPAKWLSASNKFLSIIISAKKSNLLDIFPVGEIDCSGISSELRSVVLENTRLKYLPFFSGFMKSRTGLYSGVKLDGYVHHLEIPDELFNLDVYNFVNEIACANSSIYIRDKEAVFTESKWRFDDNGIAWLDEPDNERSLNLYDPSVSNPSNLIVFDNSEMHINSLAYVSDIKFAGISYKEARRNLDTIKNEFSGPDKIMNIFQLSDEEDFEMFLEDADIYKNTHSFSDIPMAYGYLENSCRFIGFPECGVDKIPRLKVDNAGNIYTCDIELEPVARIGTSLFELGHNSLAKREKEFHDRGCYDCPTRPWCSKCTQMPDFMKNKYCEIMKKKAYVLDYALVPFIFLGLIETNPQFKDLRPEEVKVSNEYMFNIISSDIASQVAPYLPKFTSVLFCRGKYLLWSPVTNKYYNVSIQYACIIELLLKRVKAELLPELLSEVLEIDEDESKKIIKVVIDNLKKAGVIYREIE